MAIDGLTYSDDKGHHIKVTVTDEMRALVDKLLDAEKNIRAANKLKAVSEIARTQGLYSDIVDELHQMTYEANPYLDPAAMCKPDGSASHRQRIDMREAMNDTLNALIEEVAAQKGMQKPYLLRCKVRN